MARVLVTGASGLLGRDIMKAFTKEGFPLLGLCLSRVRPGLRQCDLRVEEQVAAVLSDFKPDFIIHSAAERRPDVVERDREGSHAINVTATARLCRLADACGAQVIYISTDYVFDGTNPPYSIHDTPNPLNAYGQTKRDGEVETLKYKKNMVLRVPLLYGEVETLDENGVTILFTKVKDSSSPAMMDTAAKRYPIHCADVAQVLINYLRLPEEKRPSGILHWSGNEMLTKYDMAVIMAEVMGCSSAHLVPNAVGVANRPVDSRLDCSILADLGCGANNHAFRQSIASCLAPFAK